MKVNLSLEKSSSKDVSIMVDALRASTTITIALDYFKEIIPAYSPEEAKKLAKENNSVLAGERKGQKLEGFDLGNSPTQINKFKSEKESLVLTTSNGVKAMENMMSSKYILVGGFINSKSVAKVAVELATEEIEIVMGGYNGEFAIEDFLASGDILYWIEKELNKIEENKNETNRSRTRKKGNDGIDYYWKNRDGLSEYAISAVLASRDEKISRKEILKSKSAKRLTYLNYKEDVELCLKRNISKNVAIYKYGRLELYSP